MKFHEIPIEFTTFHIVSFWSVLHCPKGESIWSIIIYFFAIKFSPQPLWKRNRTSSNLWLKSFPKVKLWSRFGRSCSNPSTQLEFHYQRFGRVASRVTASPKRQQRQKNKVVVYWTCRLRISRWILGGTSTSANRLVDVATGSVVLQPPQAVRFHPVTLHRRSLPSEISRHLALSQEHRHTTTWLPVGAPPPKKQTNKQTNNKHTNTSSWG